MAVEHISYTISREYIRTLLATSRHCCCVFGAPFDLLNTLYVH